MLINVQPAALASGAPAPLVADLAVPSSFPSAEQL